MVMVKPVPQATLAYVQDWRTIIATVFLLFFPIQTALEIAPGWSQQTRGLTCVCQHLVLADVIFFLVRSGW